MNNIALFSLLVSVVLNYTPFAVDGDSMSPTLHSGQLIVIDKQSQLQRGDIAVFSFDDQYYYVKRVIGEPGDAIKIADDSVYLKAYDGAYRPLEEPYLRGKRFEYGDERFFKVPANSYFVLGDNRNSSKDSRFFTDPYINNNLIFGKYVNFQ